MIQVKKIQPQTVECFNPEGNSLGFLNEYEFTDLRAQIHTEKNKGYYFIFDGEKCMIDTDGRYYPPKGLFETISDSLTILLGF